MAILSFLTTAPAMADAPNRVKLSVGQSKVLSVHEPKKVVVGNKAVADVGMVSSDEVLVNARASGETSLIVWTKDGGQQAFQIEVIAGGLEKTMIEVDVQVLELSDSDDWDLGLDYSRLASPNPNVPAGLPNQLNQASESAPPPLLNFGTFTRGPIDLVVKALVSRNKGKILAKPKLLTTSGATASFLAGGEIPVVNQDAVGKTNVDYKNYGVSLDIQPRADEAGNIDASIRVELSNLDAGNSVKVGTGILPALKTRWVKTSLSVKEGGTIIIAGLIQEEDSHLTNGLPILSDIPLLGELFKSHRIQSKRSELVVFVTPSLVGGAG
jgi:pilus assembly protein CpaC